MMDHAKSQSNLEGVMSKIVEHKIISLSASQEKEKI